MSKLQLEKRFQEITQKKQANLFNQTRAFQEQTMFMQHKIRNSFRSFSLFVLCGAQRTKFMVDGFFENAFSNLAVEEQIDLYEKTINIAVGLQNQQNQSAIEINLEDQSEINADRKEPKHFKVEIQEGFRSWKQIYFTIQGFKVSSVDLQFDIRSYLLRRSNKKDKECYVLEAIHFSNPKVLRFCFLTNSDIKKYLPLIKELIEQGYKEEIKRMFKMEVTKSNVRRKTPRRDKPQTEDSQKEKKNQELTRPSKMTLIPLISLQEEEEPNLNHSHIVTEIIKYPEDQNLSMELNEFIAEENERYEVLEQKTSLQFKNTERWYRNVFNLLFPSYQLTELDHFDQFKVVSTDQQNGSFVYQSLANPLLFRVEIKLALSAEVVLAVLTNPSLYKNWHPEIVQAEIKLSVSSENSAIVYQKHREYSKWYRERDFIYLRHVFQMGEDYFIADKSIENINFIPFNSIHRGSIQQQISRIIPSTFGSKLIIECHMEHGGLLNRQYICNLTTRYLLGFQKMDSYFLKQQSQHKLRSFFNPNWKIHAIPSHESATSFPKDKSRVNISNIDFDSQVVSEIDNDDLFFSIQDENEEKLDKEQKNSVHELQENQIKTNMVIEFDKLEEIKKDEEGLIILPKEYLNVKHPLTVIDSIEPKRAQPEFGDFLRRNRFNIMESGGLVVVNKEIIAAQDNVLSFMMSTFRKNILSKGPLNISLPITIFNSESQLSQFAFTLGNAPQYLEKAAKLEDPAERMKQVMVFGLSHSVAWVDIEKTFNPILGETYQSFIAGCPFYAQQISHHPPISSILLLGRGYKLYGNIEATVNIHLNSADGLNLGWNHIVFDNGQQICFQTPPAQFSGFAMGDRKFQFKDKGYYYDIDNNLFAEMCFEDFSGMFSGKKWKFRDQIEAEVLTVKNQFLNRFLTDFPSKKHSPSSKDILNRHGKLHGRWPLDVTLNGQVVYNSKINLPYESIPYQYPLNSNTNYREDLYYRRTSDDSRSQSEKQRLEQVQRGDRKCREKYCGKSQH